MRIALFCTLACLAFAMPKGHQVLHLNEERAPGEFLVVLHAPSARATNMQYASATADKIAALSSKITIVKKFTNLRTPILLVKTSEESIMSSLFQIQEVDFIESNTIQKSALSTQDCTSQNSGSRLWGLSRVSSVAQPDFNTATFNYDSSDGEGVRVYVLDTGIRLTHQDFGGRAEFGYNAAGSSDDDRNGHGTHCAGTVLGTEFGIAKRATAVAVKVLNDLGFGLVSYTLDGIDFAVGDIQSRGGPGVISMSLGGGENAATDSAVNSADAAGVPVVVAAGNDNDDACGYSPARASGAITVGNTNIDDFLYDGQNGSNYGSCVDILAPGTNILSASHESDSDSVAFTGTSMACPHVAGLAAKYLSQNPTASTAEVKSFIYGTATPNAIDLRGTSGTPNLLMYASC